MVKRDRHKRSQVNHHMEILALVKGNCRMGFQVNLATTLILSCWLKGITRGDFRLTKLQQTLVLVKGDRCLTAFYDRLVLTRKCMSVRCSN
jgi:hypothetical protein